MAEYRNIETGELLTEEQFNALKSEAEKFDRPIEAALTGAARSATFGLSDVVLTGAGLRTKEDLQALETYNPAATTAGEIGGVVAPALLSGGTGLLGTAARTVGAPARAAAKVGQLAENAALKALSKTAAQSTLKTLGAKAAAKGLGSAIEGGFYGVGQVVSEAALGDPSEAAENFLGTIGLSMLLSGGIGSAIPVAGAAIKESAKLLGPQVKQAVQNLKGVSSETERILTERPQVLDDILKMGEDVDSVRMNMSTDLANKTKSGILDAIENNKNNVRQILIDKNLAGESKTISEFLDQFQLFRDKIAPSGKAATDEVQKVLNQIDAAENKLIKFAADSAGMDPALTVQQIRDNVYIPSLRVNALNLNELKAQFQRSAKYNPDPGVVIEMGDLNRNLARVARKHLDKIDSGITSSNSNLHRLIEAEKELGSRFGFGKGTDVDPEKLSRLMKSKGDQFMWAKKHLQTIDDVTGSNLVKSVEDYRAFEELYPKQTVTPFFTGRALLPTALGSLGGAAFGGPFGAMLGAIGAQAVEAPALRLARVRAVNAVQNLLPGTSMKALSRLGGDSAQIIRDRLVPFASSQIAALSQIERANSATQNRINSSIKGILSDDDVESDSKSLEALDNTNFGKGNVIRTGDRMEAFKKRYSEIQELTSNPEKLTDLIAKNTAELNLIAPNITGALINKGIQAFGQLSQALPKSQLHDPLQPLSQKPSPTDQELARFERIVDTLENPLRVLDDLKNGSLTSDQVRVLQNTYPSIYQKITQALQVYMQEIPEVSYKTKQKLVPLFGPILPAHNQQYFGLLQATPSAQEIGSNKAPQLSSSRMSDTQRILGR